MGGGKMSMTARGHEALEQAKAQLIQAKTIEQLRQAQAVVLPLSYGLSLEQTADILGISVSWTCKLRNRFARGEVANPGAAREHRPRQNMSVEEEAEFLAPFLEKASAGGILVVGEIKRALDARLGRKTALASAYNLLHRHGWRKLAPDKRHPKADVPAQEEWKKNSRTPLRKSPGTGRAKSRSG
jgi:transposase